jgi:hypothetical protein
MSLAIAHFAFGASLGVIILLISGLYKYWIRSVVIFISGFASMIPDVHHIIPKNSFSEFAYQIHNSHTADLFFLHRTMDTVDPNDTKIFAFCCLVNLVFMLLIMWIFLYFDNLE